MHTKRILFSNLRALFFCKIRALFLYFQKRAGETSLPLPPASSGPVGDILKCMLEPDNRNSRKPFKELSLHRTFGHVLETLAKVRRKLKLLEGYTVLSRLFDFRGKEIIFYHCLEKAKGFRYDWLPWFKWLPKISNSWNFKEGSRA